MSVTKLNEESADAQQQRIKLESRLREVEGQWRSEMRARGFDPEQSDNLALTAPLARLFSEAENLRAELAALNGKRTGMSSDGGVLS